MSLAWKVAVTVILFAIAAVAAVVLIVALLGTPPTVNFTSQSPGAPINLSLQTVGSLGTGSHPTWVSYLVRTPEGAWEHTTLFQVPQHTRINVTIYQYDSGSPLRNQQLGQVTGTAGNVATLDGKVFRVINANVGNGVGHTFTIPSLGISVPLSGVTDNANVCGVAPCATSSPHHVIRFSFTTPGPGNYRWQCFVPCGAGWLFGNGGGMSKLGYMGGFMKVVA